jgi:uncharacterized protein YdeI (YjbR/CyaY-like superfamily)
MRTPPKLLLMADQESWRAWLQENHHREKEAWLILNKKHVIGPGLTYDEALDEALCFGWIDGLLQSRDDVTFTLRFTPRKARSIWSEGNKQRVERLIEAGRMTGAGMAKIREARKNGEWDKAAEREDTSVLPPVLEEALRRDGRIWLMWESLAPSRKKQYIYWVASAKTDETCRRRIQETVSLVTQEKTPGAQ